MKETNWFKNQRSKVVKIKGKKPTITKLAKKTSISQTRKTFKKRPNKPKVIIFKGKVIRFKIGFKKEFIKPNKKPTNINSVKVPKKETPGINFVANQKPKIPIAV
jgi:hypothetical protein